MKKSFTPTARLAEYMKSGLVGQDHAIDTIVPYVNVFQAGMNPAGRPAGIFILLGPTGTGKTRTTEVLAKTLHGAENKIIKVDCAEFQADHEIAKLIGSPPGYLGHKETSTYITQKAMTEATSDGCKLSIVLFDEIEKASPTLFKLLLGILDKGSLKLGDNTTINFENSLIFFTSNVGAADYEQEAVGYGLGKSMVASTRTMNSIGARALQRLMSTEFRNRIDEVITYQPLSEEQIARLLDLELNQVRDRLHTKLGENSFFFLVDKKGKDFLLSRGYSKVYGARELKRTIFKHLVQPMAEKVSMKEIQPGAIVNISEKGDELTFRVKTASIAA